MIKVLKSHGELDSCRNRLIEHGLPLHVDSYKNWDLFYLNQFVDSFEKDIKVLDSGCWNLQVAKILKHKGYKDITCIDLYESDKHWKNDNKRNKELGVVLEKGNAEDTRFDDNCFDLVTSVSVIEHGVNVDRFLKETSRILKTEGHLFLTCDYWETKIDTLPGWNIFSKEEINELILTAKEFNLNLLNEVIIPDCDERVVEWLGKSYTFLLMIFKVSK